MLSIEQLSHQVGQIIFGTVFLLVGLVAASIALLRRGNHFRILIGLAVWSAMYGTRLLILSPAVAMHFPQSLRFYIPYIDVALSYLILVFALIAWLDLTRGKLYFYMQIMIGTGLAIALAGIGGYIATGAANTFMLYNNLVTAITLLVLITIVITRKLADRFLVLPNRGMLAVGTFLFAAEALYSNLSRFFDYPTWPVFGWLGFAVLLFSLAYVAAKMIFASERRLFAIEDELETARQIQSSILPAVVPAINHLDIVAAYHPMSAVAGDFYDFIRIDSHRAGFLVADVSGHGVPAALIASMVKIAIQSVVDSAHDPGEVMRRLSRMLGNQLRGQFVTTAYLYLDTASGQARYAAAGHPPLLYWDSTARQVKSIESNGLVIGFMKSEDYPVCEFTFKGGDRFILYTDGLTEAENSRGEAFGDRRLHEVICTHADAASAELDAGLLKELQLWQHPLESQQDDLTWIIVDIQP